jgi:hypothetical protein
MYTFALRIPRGEAVAIDNKGLLLHARFSLQRGGDIM